MMTGSLAERLAVVATVDPQAVANTEKFSDVVDMSKFHAVAGIALLGDMANETIDFKAYSCDSDGSNAASLKAATQRTGSASANDNSQTVIGVRAEELLASGKRYVKFGLVTGGATGGIGAVVVVADPLRVSPASDHDLASVAEVKV